MNACFIALFEEDNSGNTDNAIPVKTMTNTVKHTIEYYFSAFFLLFLGNRVTFLREVYLSLICYRRKSIWLLKYLFVDDPRDRDPIFVELNSI